MRSKVIIRMELTMFLIGMLTLAFNIQTIKADHSITLVDNREIIATYGKAYLENVSGLPVLHVKGSPYEMGYQYGILLKNYIQDVVKDPIISDAYYINCSQIMEPYIPQEYIEEMHGLADGANVSYTDILVLNTYYDAMFYCSGFAVFGDSTIDGHLYHGYNDDWSLPPENQSVGVVTVYEPDNGNAFVNVGFFAEVSVWSGMNEEGISLSEYLSSSNDTTLEGMPVGFITKKTLQYSNNLSQAINIINQTDRATGHNILLGDGKNLNACVVEVSDNYVKAFWAGDPAEDVYPHFRIKNAVRRTNHYVDPELAATQRSPYDPRDDWNWSWSRYEKLSQLILDNYGNISAETSIEFLKTPPVAGCAGVSPNLQSMVFDSTDLELWVANANSTTSAYLREYIHLSSSDLFPTPVGGIWLPVNKLELLAQYMGLTILLAVAVMTLGYAKKRKTDTEINS